MSRPTKNKQARREALREELQAREYLRQLQEVDDSLSSNWRVLTSEQVAALRLRTDINFKRLAKVLPDLKAIELTGEDGGPLSVSVISFSDVSPEQLDT